MIPGETILSQRALGMPENPHNGPFKVMQSHGGAGWYIGTMFLACGNKDCPECADYAMGRELTKGQELAYNSRETDYMKNREQAEQALKAYLATKELPNART